MRLRIPWGGLGARTIIAVISVVMIAGAVVLATNIVVFLHRSSTRGAALVHAERRAIAATAGDIAACQSMPEVARGTAPDGLLEAPSLGLVAPVLQGSDDTVLSDAVGHVAASVWPGQPGTSVLAAHDVTWFSRITQLRPGDVIRYVTPCRTYSYRVTAHAIVQAGSPVYTTGGARLVLDTCYPLDALFTTSTRYLVYAALVESSPTHPFSPMRASWPVPAVPAPPALTAQGLSDASNYAPLGTLAIAGTPPATWRQSSAPLAFETAALAEYFGLTRSAAENRHTWWTDLAPSVPASAAGALWNGVIAAYDTRLSVSLSVRGGQPLGATLSASVTVAGAGYQVTVTETVRGGKLFATQVTVSP
jgi:sortase A